jgi:acyl carrier protein
MVNLEDIVYNEIQSYIAKYKPIDEEQVQMGSLLVNDLKVSGDDLSEITYTLHKKFGIDQLAGDYSSVMTVGDWVNLIVVEVESAKAR